MAPPRRRTIGARAVLAADGVLLTAGAMSLAAGLAGALAWLGLGGVFVVLATFALAVGPLIAWLLHGHRADGRSTLAALLGYLIGLGIVLGGWWVVDVIDRYDTSLGLSRDAGGMVGPVVVGLLALLLVAAAVWLDGVALRDLRRVKRDHTWLDVVRLGATAAVLALLVSQRGDGLLLMLVSLSALLGGVVVVVAWSLTRSAERHGRPRLVSGA